MHVPAEARLLSLIVINANRVLLNDCYLYLLYNVRQSENEYIYELSAQWWYHQRTSMVTDGSHNQTKKKGEKYICREENGIIIVSFAWRTEKFSSYGWRQTIAAASFWIRTQLISLVLRQRFHVLFLTCANFLLPLYTYF